MGCSGTNSAIQQAMHEFIDEDVAGAQHGDRRHHVIIHSTRHIAELPTLAVDYDHVPIAAASAIRRYHTSVDIPTKLYYTLTHKHTKLTHQAANTTNNLLNILESASMLRGGTFLQKQKKKASEKANNTKYILNT